MKAGPFTYSGLAKQLWEYFAIEWNSKISSSYLEILDGKGNAKAKLGKSPVKTSDIDRFNKRVMLLREALSDGLTGNGSRAAAIVRYDDHRHEGYFGVDLILVPYKDITVVAAVSWNYYSSHPVAERSEDLLDKLATRLRMYDKQSR